MTAPKLASAFADSISPAQQNTVMSQSIPYSRVVYRQKPATTAFLLCGLSFILNACGTGVAGNSGADFDLSALLPSASALPVEVAENNSTEATVPAIAMCTSTDQSVREHIVMLINDARAEARSCGNEYFDAASPVQWSEKLAVAARAHSEDMATHNFFSHTGSDGSDVSDRISRADYQWSGVGENIAAGRNNAAETMSDWLGSAGHCRNLMNPDFTEVAVVCVENEHSDYQRYWTNTLGSPG